MTTPTRRLRPVLLLPALLACGDPTGPPPIAPEFGFITIGFSGQSLRFSRAFDSVIAYYDPAADRLSLVGSTAPGPAAPDNLLLLIDSLPYTGPFHLGQSRPLRYLSVAFYETPGSDSSRVVAFVTAGDSLDSVTLDLVDFSTCEVRGTFRTTLFRFGDPPGYPVQGAFWGRMIWNSVNPGPC